MITGDEPWDSRVTIWHSTAGFLTNEFVRANVRTGGVMVPYLCAPDIGTFTGTFFYSNQKTVPTINPGTTIEVRVKRTALVTVTIWKGTVSDVSQVYRLEENTGKYGCVLTIFAQDLISTLNQTPVPGVITSASTKYQTWEERLTTTLQPYFPAGGGAFPVIGTPSHAYRLVDNNVDGTLYDQVALAHNSVGATWYINPSTNVAYFQAKGMYTNTACYFTDTLGYWNTTNSPGANARNLQLKTLELSKDTRYVTNAVTVRNVMPANMITRSSDGLLLYKDPATTKVDSLEVIEPSYTTTDATSITNNGRRPSELLTNIYPYRTTDSDSFYVRYNASLDPYCEYQNINTLTSNVANTTFSTTSVYSGTYCAVVTLNSAQSSWAVYASEAIEFRPYARTGTIASWRIRMRAPNTTTTVYIQAEFQDASGNILSTYSPATPVTLAQNTYTQLSLSLPAASIPTGAVRWRPRLSINANPVANWAIGTAWRFDEIEINPYLDTSQMFNGDTVDTATDLYEWQGYSGDSWSYRMRNVLDNIGQDAIAYLKDPVVAPRYMEWNVREDWSVINQFIPSRRIDIHFNQTDYKSWIDTLEYEITPDNMIAKMYLSPRPSTW